MKGNVRKIIKFSAVDGPGNTSAVFFQGCNLNCLYCHNPETIPIHDKEAALMNVLEVFSEIGSAQKYIRGISVSGGECMLQRDFVYELCRQAKSRGLAAYIDTNGTYDFSKDKDILPYVDGIMLDIKSADEGEHKKITGSSNKIVLKNMEYLADCGKLFEIRTVLSEQLLNCQNTVKYVSEFLGRYNGIRYKLIKYRPNGVRREFISRIKVPSNDFMENLRAIAVDNGVSNVVII